MSKIKGPFNVSMKGKRLSEFISEQVGGNVGIQSQSARTSLPFQAEGWRSEKNYDMVPGGKKLTNEKEIGTGTVRTVEEVSPKAGVSAQSKRGGRVKNGKSK